MTMIATQNAFANGLAVLDGGTCEFMGSGMAIVHQRDDTKMRVSAVPLSEKVLQMAERLEASEDAPTRRAGMVVDNIHIHLTGDETILFAYDDKDTGTEEDVVLMLEDVRKMLTVLQGGTAH